MLFNINQYLNPNHLPVFQCADSELIVYGGANAGKSYTIADKLLLQSVQQPDVDLKALIIRKTFPALRVSALEILEKRAELLRLPFRLNEAKWIGQCGRMKYVFQSLNNKDDYAKLHSQTDIDFIWINEVHQLREDDYEECLRRMRGGNSSYAQIIVDFNPIGKTSWVYKRFFEKNINNVRKLRYTVLDNHPAYLALEKTREEVERLKATKVYNKNFYKIYFLGEWGELEDVIYDWDIVGKTKEQEKMSWTEIINPDEIFYGGDFGYSVDPSVLIRIYRKGREFWLEEIIHEPGLTNTQLGRKMDLLNIPHDAITYWDCAEPKSIQELCDMGFNAKPCEKGPDSVIAGIDFLCDQDIHIIDGSEHISDEQRSYVRQEDKDGNILPKPIEFNNHAMDASRYGIHTHCKGIQPGATIPDTGTDDIWQ